MFHGRRYSCPPAEGQPGLLVPDRRQHAPHLLVVRAVLLRVGVADLGSRAGLDHQAVGQIGYFHAGQAQRCAQGRAATHSLDKVGMQEGQPVDAFDALAGVVG